VSFAIVDAAGISISNNGLVTYNSRYEIHSNVCFFPRSGDAILQNVVSGSSGTKNTNQVIVNMLDKYSTHFTSSMGHPKVMAPQSWYRSAPRLASAWDWISGKYD